MPKPLRLLILEYMNTNHAHSNHIDVLVPFSHLLSTMKERGDFRSALSALEKDALIHIGSSDYRRLASQLRGELTPLSDFRVMCRITDNGERKITDKQPSININGSQGVIIGGSDHNLRLSNCINANKKDTVNKSDSMVRQIIISVVSGLILFFIVSWLSGWIPWLKP